LAPQFFLALAQETGWTQINGEKAARMKHIVEAPVGSRRHRRLKPPQTGQPSQPPAVRRAKRK